MGKSIRLAAAFAWLLSLVVAAAAHADVNSGAQWLASTAQTNGSYALPGDISTPLQSTAEALRAFNAVGVSNNANAGAAAQFIAAEPYQNSENLSRLIITAVLGGQNPSALVIQLETNQDSASGGFAELPGYQPTVLDTAFALEALALSGNNNSQAAAAAVGFLQQQQATDGSWTDGDNAPSVYLSALSLASLQYYAGTYSLSSTLQAGSNFLLSARQGDGLWGQDFLGGLSLIALLQTLSDTTTIQAGVGTLQSHQLADGSWGDDTYVTSVVLRALALANARGGGASGTGAVQGYVTQAGSSQPISGAVVTVPSIQGLSVQTNSAGYFTLSGLPAGNVTLVANKAGFSSASAVVAVAANATATANNLVLAPGSQSGTMRVHLVDAGSGAVLAGASVSITGSQGTLSGSSDNGGNVEFDNLAPGNYSLSIQDSGYQAVQGTLAVSGGQVLNVNQPLQSSTTLTGSGASTLGGTVADALSGAPISGAVFNLGTGHSATSGADGSFSLGGVNGGTYTATVSATGYASQTLSLTVPAGTTATLGTIGLYQASSTTAPNTVTLVGTVIDGLSNKPVSGVAVTIANSSLSATSNGQGQFTISGIPALSFTLQLAASGYTNTSFGVTASAYGSVSGNFALPPVGAGGSTTTNLQGQITDAGTGAAISGATVQVAGSSLSAQTDANGNYQLQNLPSLSFNLQVSALNYTTQNLSINLTSAGSYTLNVQLSGSQSAASSFQVLSLSTGDAGKGANQTQIFTAQVGNQGSASAEGVLVGRILDANGNQVATTSPYAPGTQTPQSDFTFAAQEVKTLQVPWNPAQLPPGAYTMELDVVKPGSITRALPTGTILAKNSAYTSVSATQSFIGTLAFNPPAAQAGTTSPVSLQVLVVNSGNVPLSGTALTLSIMSADGSTAVETAQTTLAQPLPVAQFVYVPFGSWVPSQSGNLPVSVSAGGGVQGQITGTFYVGDKPQGAFSITPTDVFVGNQTVQATIDVTGVDKAITVQSPLVTAIRTAIQNGIPYVATNVIQDQQSSRCLRCHVQSQSYYGLASLLGHDVGSDPVTTQFVYNAIATSQQSDGSLHSAYNQYVETQTALELWALSQTPDKVSSFATKYKAAQFMQSRVSTSGSQDYWNPDYGSGWWASVDGHNMLTVTGLVDMLLTAQNNNVANVIDYSTGTATALSGAPDGLKLGPDGALYAMSYNAGTILRYDPSSGNVTTVFSGLPGHCTTALPISATEFYVACPGSLIHAMPDGTQQTAASGLGSAAGDVVQGSDGSIYVSDSNNNQILRGMPGGAFTSYVSGGLINNPIGMALGADGSLYVANYNSFNILKVAPGAATVTVFSDALSFKPVYLLLNADGSMFAGHDQYYEPTSGQTTSEGMLLISNQGEAKRVFTLPGLRGMAMAGSQLYMVSYTSNALYPLVTKPLDTSQLSTFAATITGVVNYTLAEYNNSPDIFQLITLGEASKVVTDPALLAQINQAMTALDKVMRSRQNSDGGWWWSYSGQPSDALATALVGIGLEYLAPPANDPVLLNAVSFLLNTQAADGSWSSADGIMSTRFATTGLVMAFLPRVLDQIGGLNIQLHLNLPSNITLTSPNVPQSGDLNNPDGSSNWTWNFNGVTSSGRVLTFNLNAANLQPGEKRPAASAAYLLSTNSFDGSQVQVNLAIPTINASDEMSLTSVATDSASYSANGTAQISGQVLNSAPASQSGTVVFTIKAADGSVVATLPAVPFTNLAANASTTVSTSWNVGTTLAGTYPVVGDLYDSNGVFVNEQSTSLSVLTGTGTGTGGGGTGPNTEVTLRVSTDKQTYNTTDQVNIGDLVKNISVNGLVASASLQLTVLDPNGNQVFTVSVPLGQLTPGYLRQLSNLYGLKASPTGAYSVNGVIVDGTGAVLATGSASFKVIENLAQTIVGTEAVQSPWVYQGDAQTCNDAVSDIGTLAANNLPVQQLIINLDTGTIDVQANTTASLAAGGTQTYVRNFSTGGLALGHHACVIQAQINGTYQTLANAPFEVRQPPVRVSGGLGLGDKGRLLVLLDEPTDHGPPLCNNGLADITLEAGINQNLSPNAVVEVKLLNSLGLIVDTETTSLKSFTGEVNLNIGKFGVDLVIPSFTTNNLVVQVLGTGAGKILSGTYRVVANITDQTNLQYLTFDSGLISCACNVLGSVGSILNNTFTLIGLNDSISNAGTGIGDGQDSTPIPQQESTLKSLLSQDGWSYDIVLNKNDFATKFRDGGYQDYALLSEYQVLDPQVQEELREHVYNGEGLLVAGRHDVRTRILDNPLGIDYRGTQLVPVGVQMLNGNVFNLSGQEIFSQGNQVQRFDLTGATADGNVISGIPTAQLSLVTHYGYGNGTSALGGYDMLAEASAEKTPNLFSSLIRKPLLYVNPSQANPTAGRVVPVHLTITNTGIANSTQAVVTTSLNSYVVAANAGTVANGKLVWTTSLAVSQSASVDLWVQLSSDGSPVTVTATLTASTSTFTALPVVVTQVINPLVKPSLVKAIADLSTYVANQPPPGLLGLILDPILGLKTPAAAALGELKQAQTDLNAGNAQQALSDMVWATSYLINDGSASLKPIRLEVDEAIEQAEKLQ